jgi:hypothetical protein
MSLRNSVQGKSWLLTIPLATCDQKLNVPLKRAVFFPTVPIDLDQAPSPPSSLPTFLATCVSNRISFSAYTLELWKWRQHDPLICWYAPTKLHGTTTQETSICSSLVLVIVWTAWVQFLARILGISVYSYIWNIFGAHWTSCSLLLWIKTTEMWTWSHCVWDLGMLRLPAAICKRDRNDFS